MARGVYTPDDIAAGMVPEGPVVVFDFGQLLHGGGAIAEQLAKSGGDVQLRHHRGGTRPLGHS